MQGGGERAPRHLPLAEGALREPRLRGGELGGECRSAASSASLARHSTGTGDLTTGASPSRDRAVGSGEVPAGTVRVRVRGAMSSEPPLPRAGRTTA